MLKRVDHIETNVLPGIYLKVHKIRFMELKWKTLNNPIRQRRLTYKAIGLRMLLTSISGLTVYLIYWNANRMYLISTRPRITQSVEWLRYGLEDRRTAFRFPSQCPERLWNPPNPCLGVISSAGKATRVWSWSPKSVHYQDQKYTEQ
jgi:hypothetical protein